MITAFENMRRIMIIGQPGSGKSTLARKLGDRLNLPVFHIDRIHWQPGWIERPGPEKDRLCAEVHARERWIFEGGRSVTWPERLDRADTLIWLDFPLSVRAWRVFMRTVKYHGQSRPDSADNCPENFNWEFTSWIWNTRNTGRERMREFFNQAPAGKQTFQLTNKKQVDSFVESLRSNH